MTRQPFQTVPLPSDFTATLRALHARRDPRLAPTLAAAQADGWTFQALGEAIGVTRERVRKIARDKPHECEALAIPSFQQAKLAPPHVETDEAVLRQLEEAARAESRAWMDRQQSEVVDHEGGEEPPDDQGYQAWRARVEAGDIGDTVQMLTLHDVKVEVAGFPGSFTQPWPGTCLRCGAPVDVVLDDLPPKCDHGGAGGPAPLTAEGKAARRQVYRDLREEKSTEAARAAGWDPQEPCPPRDRTPWLLACATCGRKKYATLAGGDHEKPCPHQPLPGEEEARKRLLAAGWEVLETPVPGDRTNKDRYSIRCTTCGFETRRVAKKPALCARH
ncbi:hypothetical protein [Streptomyces sp. SM12]|uniref:hypothetical protein n=1 Tax=Streptomyces sp. SM12 TaxID=1071602 RepID=UPI000CD49E63|nr:hypothetical protein [Streptomyces sp. SM12]